MKFILTLMLWAVMFAPALAATGHHLSDSVIVSRIIRQSRAEYPSDCACPYNVDRRGHSCGRRSAYVRPGGYAPLCYPRNVTRAMIAAYRAQHAN